MGGSVSTLLQAIARDNGVNKTECYAFSPAPCISEAENSRLLSSDCYSFVIENDVVPRASKKAITIGIKRLVAFTKQREI